MDEAYDLLRTSVHSQHPDGSETIEINNIHIHSSADGVLTLVSKTRRKCLILYLFFSFTWIESTGLTTNVPFV